MLTSQKTRQNFRHWLEDQRIEPRRTQPFGGVDHGSKGKILAEIREGNEIQYRLVWFKGYKTATCGIRGFGHEYVPASLRIIDRIGMTVPGSDLLEGGRLTSARLDACASKIDQTIGIEISCLLEREKTLIIVR